MFGLLKHIQYMVFGFKWHVPCSSAEPGALHGLNTRSLQEKPSAATAPSNQDEAGRSCVVRVLQDLTLQEPADEED